MEKIENKICQKIQCRYDKITCKLALVYNNSRDGDEMTSSDVANRQILHQLLKVAEDDKDFADVEDKRKRFLAAMAVLGGTDYQTQACKLADISYDARARRDSIECGLWDEHSGYLLSLAKGLTAPIITPKPRAARTNDILDVLDSIIHGDARDSDKVRAIESRQKLEEKRAGSSTLKPFERIWLEVILPRLFGIEEVPCLVTNTGEIDENKNNST